MDVWHFSTWIGVCSVVILVCWDIKGSPLLKWPYLYALLYSCSVSFSLFQTAVDPLTLAIKLGAAKVFGTLVLFGWYFSDHSYVSTRSKYYLKLGILLMFTLDAIWLLFGGDGIMVGYTQDSLMMAVLIPMFLQNKYFRFAIPILLAYIIYSKGAAAYVVVAFQIVMFRWYTVKSWWVRTVDYIIFAGVALYLSRSSFLQNHDIWGKRWNTVWRGHLLWWGKNANGITGTGPGSFEWIATTIRVDAAGAKMWLHSDWLQILFEYGLIGLGLAVVAYAYVGRRLTNRPCSLVTWLSLGIAMLVYSPLQFWYVQFLVAYLISQAEFGRQE